MRVEIEDKQDVRILYRIPVMNSEYLCNFKFLWKRLKIRSMSRTWFPPLNIVTSRLASLWIFHVFLQFTPTLETFVKISHKCIKIRSVAMNLRHERGFTFYKILNAVVNFVYPSMLFSSLFLLLFVWMIRANRRHRQTKFHRSSEWISYRLAEENWFQRNSNKSFYSFITRLSRELSLTLSENNPLRVGELDVPLPN